MTALHELQVKQRYDGMLHEMGSFRAERERWQAQQEGAEQQLAAQREQLDADSQRLQDQYDALVTKQQQRAAEWEAAAQEDDAALSRRKQVRGHTHMLLL